MLDRHFIKIMAYSHYRNIMCVKGVNNKIQPQMTPFNVKSNHPKTATFPSHSQPKSQSTNRSNQNSSQDASPTNAHTLRGTCPNNWTGCNSVIC